MGPFDYLVGATAYLYAYEPDGGLRFPDTAAQIAEHFEKKYDHSIDIALANRILEELSRLEFIGLTIDKYAGELIEFDQDKFNSRYDSLSKENQKVFISIHSQALDFYERAISNEKLWKDLSLETDSGALSEDRGALDRIPASDRIVTISHNSEDGQVLALSLTQIIDDLEKNNSIAAEAGGDRERLLAEAKASRELLRGETISSDKLKFLVLRFFEEIAKKFREQTATWTLDQVFSVLLKILDLLK